MTQATIDLKHFEYDVYGAVSIHKCSYHFANDNF